MGLLQGKFLTEFLSQNTITDGVYSAATWCGGNNKKERLKGLIMATRTKTKNTSTSKKNRLLNRLSKMIDKMELLGNDVMDGQVSAYSIYDRLDDIKTNIEQIHDALTENTND